MSKKKGRDRRPIVQGLPIGPQGSQMIVAPNGIEATWEYVGPEQAEKMLAFVDPEYQRRLRPEYVAAYALALKAGDWSGIAPTAIMFDDKGRLRNGQTRCHAIIESGIGRYFSVWRQVPSEQCGHIDERGIQRSLEQSVKDQYSVTLNKWLVGTLKAVVTITGGPATRWTVEETHRQWRRHGAKIEMIEQAARPKSQLTRAAVMAAFVRACYLYDHAVVVEAVQAFVSGKARGPLFLLREWILKHAGSTGQRGLGALNSNANVVLYQRTARALEAHIDNHPLQKLQAPRGLRRASADTQVRLGTAAWDPFPLPAQK